VLSQMKQPQKLQFWGLKNMVSEFGVHLCVVHPTCRDVAQKKLTVTRLSQAKW